jgi:hypothetical protein
MNIDLAALPDDVETLRRMVWTLAAERVNAKLTDKHLASTVHCVDDEIIGWLKRREQHRRDRLAGSRQSVYRYLP